MLFIGYKQKGTLFRLSCALISHIAMPYVDLWFPLSISVSFLELDIRSRDSSEVNDYYIKDLKKFFVMYNRVLHTTKTVCGNQIKSQFMPIAIGKTPP